MTHMQRACLTESLINGYDLLKRGRSAIDAVETTIRILEASGLFNAGVGARFQLDGVRRMDASIMEGAELRGGAVAAVEGVRHPITAAKLVMRETGHVLLVGPPATRFARYHRLEQQRPRRAPGQEPVRSDPVDRCSVRTLNLFERMNRNRRSLETVGAVALDQSGTVAAGASTGGIAHMLPGRVGDTPLIGCGVYADNDAGAVSMTGIGEGIIRIGIAKEIIDRLAGGTSPSVAVRQVLEKLVTRIRGSAGALVLASDGRLAIRHTTTRMAAGHWRGKGKPVVSDSFLP